MFPVSSRMIKSNTVAFIYNNNTLTDRNRKKKPGSSAVIVLHTCSPSIQEADEGGTLCIPGQAGL